jgi:hypothetical protein
MGEFTQPKKFLNNLYEKASAVESAFGFFSKSLIGHLEKNRPIK